MRNFSYHKPKSLRQALDLLSRYGEEAALLAGGTDLLVELKRRLKNPSHIIDLKGLSFMEGIFLDSQGTLHMGPLTTLKELSSSSLLANEWSLLSEAASKVGSLQVRNRATVGGNICHASPSGDTLPALLCLDAMVTLLEKDGQRTLPLEDFFLGPGKCALITGELLTEIKIPSPPAGAKGVYKKLSLRKAMDLAVVGVAVLGVIDPSRGIFRDIRIGLGAVGPTPLRARRAEEILMGAAVSEERIREAAARASNEAHPLSDLRASEWYRREMITHLAEEGIKEILAAS